jgi:hypothetical protein
MTKIDDPLISSAGFIPDETTGINDVYYRQLRARKQARREQALELLIILSALESWMFSLGKAPPDYLIERIDKAVDVLKNDVLSGGE